MEVSLDSVLYQDEYTFYSNEYCIPPDEYTFTIHDDAEGMGDGFEYNITYDGMLVKSGTNGDFEFSESTTFGESQCLPICEDSNPQACGCISAKQTDYRGMINMTKSGHECMRWNETNNYTPEDYPDAGL